MRLPGSAAQRGLPQLTRVSVATSAATDPAGLVGGTFRVLVLLDERDRVIAATIPTRHEAFDALWPGQSLEVLPTAGVDLVREKFATQEELTRRYPGAVLFSRLLTPRAGWAAAIVLIIIVLAVVALTTY
jgi:hypothetical protein